MMRLRPATADDAELLLEWRNDSDTRKSSIKTEKVKKVEHVSWLSGVLESRNRLLLIAEEEGVPIGTVRADLSDGIYQLSWTVAPDARGRGLGKQMVAMAAHRITAPIRAQVKSDNVSSVLIAEYAGMEFNQELDGFLYFSRPAQK
jgi:RimJ/RimL family protein N-acetyltransferase